MSQLCPDVRTNVPTCSNIVKSMILRRKVVENIRKVSNRCILSIKWPFVYSVCGRLMGSIAETLRINPEQKIFSFDSVLPSESCLRAPLPPKTCRKIFQIFFLGPHWNSLAESKFSWGLMVFEEIQAKSRTVGGTAPFPPVDDSQYFWRQTSDNATNVHGYPPRLCGTYKKGLNIFSRLSSKCELIFDLVFFSVHKK